MTSAVPSPSESTRFGISVGRLDYAQSTEWDGVDVAGDIAESDFDLIIVRFPAEVLDVVRRVQESRRPSLIADTLLHFRRSPLGGEQARGVMLRPLSLADASVLDDLVADVFRGHRNHYDANPLTRGVDLVVAYQEWARKLVEAPAGTAYAIQIPGDDNAGLVVTESSGTHLEVVLVGLRPRARGAGRYRDVLQSLAVSSAVQGRTSIGVLTQAWNTAAMRSLIRTGFEPDYAVSTLHVMR